MVDAPAPILSEEERSTLEPRRLAVRWSVAAVLIVAVFVGVVAVLNSTLYSAQGFVGFYLDSLARHDVDAAVRTPGVTIKADAAVDLLAPDALGELTEMELITDTDEGDGVHRVSYRFELDGTEGESEYVVERDGTLFGLFSAWTFRQSPATVLQITPRNDATFDANGLRIQSAAGPDLPVRYNVLTPGVFTLSHESELLEAQPASILVLDATVPAETEVQIVANSTFVDLVQDELNSALDECATQQVLQPTGCPFGETITNRIEGAPAWSIAAYPEVTIVPGEDAGTWRVPDTPGTAHLVVDVRSLFDGTLTTFDNDVPFTVGYLITVAGGNVTITAT